MMSSFYIRGANSSVLIKLLEPTNVPSIDHHEAAREAEEMGILPGGTLLIYSVVEQDMELYNKLFTQDMADQLRSYAR